MTSHLESQSSPKPSAVVSLDTQFSVGEIDRRLFGSFLEHIGRAIYTGIYEPSHTQADEHGWRKDVVAAVKELGVSVVRYPGGNFVSTYRWEDGIGPREQRPRRIDLAWKSIESNQVGVDEFMQWSAMAGTEPMMCLNLATRGIEDAINLIEYCNYPSGTHYSDLRRKNGSADPYGIKLWCLGNEMDGPWQMGAKSARDYGAIARETAKALRCVDENIECIACGSSGPFLPTHPRWEAEVAEEAYDQIDYIAIHIYYEKGDRDAAAFLNQHHDFDKYITDTLAAIDYVRACRRSKKTIHLAVDEWNVWNDKSDLKDRSKQRIEAPALLEETYDHLDALLVGAMLITMLNRCDRVKIACLAQLVNVIAPIHTTPGRGVVRQSIFFPFADAAHFHQPHVLRCGCGEHSEDLVLAATINADQTQLVLFIVNKASNGPRTLNLVLNQLGEVKAAKMFSRGDMVAGNEPDWQPLSGVDSIVLPALTWNVLWVELEAASQ